MASLLTMAIWFSASAVLPQITSEFGLNSSQKAWMTLSVQFGFVIGTLVSAILNLADRMSARRLFAISAMIAGIFTLITIIDGVGLSGIFIMRFLAGAMLAGVYPPGMKLVATWCKQDRGFGSGLLVGALTVGSAFPHLVNALHLFGASGFPPWRTVITVTSIQALFAGVLILLLFREGPYAAASAPFNWRFAFMALRHTPTRLANFGYLGHMWELYAMWTWVPLMLLNAYDQSGMSNQMARLAGFATVAAGGIGSLMAGILADRLGRTTITIVCLIVSGICCLVAGFFISYPIILTLLCLIWGFFVVADSAQFSAAVSELTDPRYVGTALTIQTCLGFLLTMVSIWIIPALAEAVGWRYAFMVLSIGPVLGVWSMMRLRRHPEAVKLASGRR